MDTCPTSVVLQMQEFSDKDQALHVKESEKPENFSLIHLEKPKNFHWYIKQSIGSDLKISMEQL